jgi:tricorn protease-like protein
VIPVDGGRAQQLTTNPSTVVFPSFSRDGQWIYFSSSRNGAPSIWKTPVSGGTAVHVSPFTGLAALESRDGAYLYYVESPTLSSPGPLWQLSLKGGERVKLLDGVIPVSFEVVESGIYYFERLTGELRLQYFDFATRQSTMVAENLGNVNPGLTASPDGRTILYSRVDTSINNLMLVENFR